MSTERGRKKPRAEVSGAVLGHIEARGILARQKKLFENYMLTRRSYIQYTNGPDLRWCRLSNILTVGITPITSDGFGLIHIRNSHATSTEGGLLACFFENI